MTLKPKKSAASEKKINFQSSEIKKLIKKILFVIIDKILAWHQFQTHENIRKKYNITPAFGFNGKDIKIMGEGKITIGDGSYVCNRSQIRLHKNQQVQIGKGCSISHNVKIYTTAKIPDYNFEIKAAVPEKTGNVIIGDYVWIGQMF